jgi:ADP-ribosylglycohydrolase
MINEDTKQSRNRYHGALLGLAAGDAFGTTLEFKSPGTFRPLADMVGGGPFNLQPGQRTDDTGMALCLGKSLVQCQGFFDLEGERRREAGFLREIRRRWEAGMR